MLLEAVLRFQAQARSELLPTDGPVKIRNDNNNSTSQEDHLADALKDDANHYLTVTARSIIRYRPNAVDAGLRGDDVQEGLFLPSAQSAGAGNGRCHRSDRQQQRDGSKERHPDYAPVNRSEECHSPPQLIGEYLDVDLHTPDAVKLNQVDRQKAETEGVQKGDYYGQKIGREFISAIATLISRG